MLGNVLPALADATARVALWGLVALACARLAARALRSDLTGIAHVVWDGAAGLALLLALLIAIGLVPGGFHVTTVRLVVAAWVVAGMAATRGDPVPRFRGAPRADAPTRAFLAGVAILAAVGLAWDRVPPVFFDTRAYQFALPEMWLIAGRIGPEPWSLHSWFPPGMPVLYGVGLAAGGERVANDANLLVGLGLIAAAFDLARRSFGAAAGPLAAGFVVSTPLIFYALAIPAADLGHGFFVFASLAALLLRHGDDGAWRKRAALLAAGAVLTKYLGLVAPLAIGALWLAKAPRGRLRAAAGFAAPSLALLLPWLASNAVVIGNPVAPVAASILPPRGIAPGGAERFRGDAHGGTPDAADLRAIVPRWITGSEADGRIYPTPAFGWLPFVALPLAVIAARDDRRLRAVLALAAILVAVWLFTFRWERFLVAAGAFIGVASAGGVVAAARRLPTLRALPALSGAAIALSIVPPAIAVDRFNAGVRVAVGRQSPADFIEGGLPSARLFRDANARLDPRRDRVLLVGEMRHYGLAVPRCAPTGFNRHPLVELLASDPDPARANAALRRAGFSHLVVDPGWVARSAAQYPSLALFRERPDLFERYVASLGPPLAVEDAVALYEIPR